MEHGRHMVSLKFLEFSDVGFHVAIANHDFCVENYACNTMHRKRGVEHLLTNIGVIGRQERSRKKS